MRTDFKEALIRLLVLSCIVLLMAAGCKSRSSKATIEEELTGNISISGAFALYPITVRWASEFKKIHPKVQFDIAAGGTETGVNDVLSNKVDLAMFSSDFSEEKQKKLAGFVVAKDAVLPTISAANPYIEEIKGKGFDLLTFQKIFVTGDYKSWDEVLNLEVKRKLNVYTRTDACGAGRIWASYLGAQQDDLLGAKVFGDNGIADALRVDKYGIGYNNLAFVYNWETQSAYEGLYVVPIDLNGNGKLEEQELFYDSLCKVVESIENGTYPSPPARELYLVSNGKPKRKLVVEFLKFILTDGQIIVNNTGYVEIPSDVIEAQLNSLQSN